MNPWATLWFGLWIGFFLGWKLGRKEFAYWLVRHPNWRGLSGARNDGQADG